MGVEPPTSGKKKMYAPPPGQFPDYAPGFIIFTILIQEIMISIL